MLRYIVKRVIFFLPTLVLVSLIVFFCKNGVVGDETASLLRLEGVESDMEDYDRLYESKYIAQGKELPAFYFSLRPNYIKTPINTVTNTDERSFVKYLVKQRYPSTEAISLASALGAKEKYQQLLFSEDLDYILQSTNDDADITSLIQKMNDERSQYHYPSIYWNGRSNQYHRWITDFLSGSKSVSLIDGQRVSSKVYVALRWTLILLLANIFFTLLIAIPYGLYTGMKSDQRFDIWSGNILFAIFSMPSFWLATVLILFFASNEYGMKIFPSVGRWYTSGATSFWEVIQQKWTLFILPLLVLVVKDVAYLGRLIRDTVVAEKNKQYVTTAKAKGSSEARVVRHHIFRNAMNPAITLIVGAVPSALGGTLLMEVIFNIPGMGRLLMNSIRQADWPVVFPILLFTAFVTVIFYLIGDVLKAMLNPKIKYD